MGKTINLLRWDGDRPHYIKRTLLLIFFMLHFMNSSPNRGSLKEDFLELKKYLYHLRWRQKCGVKQRRRGKTRFEDQQCQYKEKANDNKSAMQYSRTSE